MIEHNISKETRILTKITVSMVFCFLFAIFLFLNNALSLKERASDPTVIAGYGVLYSKTDGKLYFRSDDGTTYEISSGGGSGNGHSLDAADGNPSNEVYVDNSGNVGIGTTTPGEKLDVNGTIEATAFIGGTRFNYESDEVVSDAGITMAWAEIDIPGNSNMPARRTFVILKIENTNDGSGDEYLAFRPSDSSYDIDEWGRFGVASADPAGVGECSYVCLPTGPDGKVDWVAIDANTDARYTVVLIGWL